MYELCRSNFRTRTKLQAASSSLEEKVRGEESVREILMSQQRQVSG
jgi:hypothetical protein